jgi:hypothetical protein
MLRHYVITCELETLCVELCRLNVNVPLDPILLKKSFCSRLDIIRVVAQAWRPLSQAG